MPDDIGIEASGERDIAMSSSTSIIPGKVVLHV